MANESVRIQMSPETKKELEKLAEQHGCFYGTKGAIALLLARIADKRLIVSEAKAQQSKPPGSPLLKLSMSMRSGLKGTLAPITKTIATYKGNILEAEVEKGDKTVKAQIALSMPEEQDLERLIEDLQKLKIRDIAAYNQATDLGKLSVEDISEDVPPQQLHSKTPTTRKRSRAETDARVVAQLQAVLAKATLDQQLILDISCTIGLKLVIENKPGVLAQVSDAIAREGFYLSSAKQSTDPDSHYCIMELTITLHPTANVTLESEIGNVHTIVTTLNQISSVKDIKRLGIDYL